MMIIKCLLIATIQFFQGCASQKPTISLSSQELALIKANPQDNSPRSNLEQYWINLYFSGKKYLQEQNLPKACLQFEKLFLENDFPLRPIINLKMLESCYQNVGDLVAFWDLAATNRPSWYQRKYLDLSLSLARKHQLRKYEVIFLRQIALLQANPAEKLEKLEEALAIAQQNNLDDEVKNLQQSIIQIAPRKTSPNYSRNLMAIAKDLTNHREFPKARQMFRRIIDNSKFDLKDRLKAFDQLRFTFKLDGQKEEYQRQTQELIKFISGQLIINPQDEFLQKGQIRYQIILSRIYWTQHQTDLAQQQLHAILTNPRLDDPNRGLIYQLLGSIELEKSNYASGISFLQQALSLTILNSTKSWDLKWSIAWAHYSAKNHTEAIKLLEDMIMTLGNGNPSLKTKAQFWIGKIYHEQNNLDKAQEYLAPLLEEDLFGYYGALAHYLLRKKISPVNPPMELPQKNLPVFDWLQVLDEEDLAQRYLLSMLKQNQGAEEVIEFLPLLSQAKMHHQVIWTFARLSSEEQKHLLKDYLHLLYPVAYLDMITEQSREKNVPPEYILAIIRQESTFNPYARSPADAFGLMQIIPAQAFSLAAGLNINLKSKYDLYQPQINIQLGAELLRQLIEKSKGQKIFSSAAYNAGEDPVHRWLQQYYQGDPIAFIENISYNETRNYIKMIIRNLINYQRLTAQEDFYFPEQYLQGLDSLATIGS